MRKNRIVLCILGILLISLFCANPLEPETGQLVLYLEQDGAAGLGKKAVHAAGWKPSPPNPVQEIASIVITLQPGNLVFEFDYNGPEYVIEAELGIYTLTIRGLDASGNTVFAADTTEILIEPNKTASVSIELKAAFPTSAPVFTGLLPVNLNNNGQYRLAWSPVDQASHYTVHEDTAEHFPAPQVVYSGSDTACAITKHTDGTYFYRAQASNEAGASPWSAVVSMVVLLTQDVSILTDDLPVAVAGNAYSASITAAGGVMPYEWQILSGALPSGLDMTAEDDLLISGVPDQAGDYSLTVQVLDSSQPQKQAEKTYLLKVLPRALEIITDSLATGTRGVAYDQQVCAIGGSGNLEWILSSGTLPPGLELESGTQCVSIAGTPTSAGAFDFTLTVADTAYPDSMAEAGFTILIQEQFSELKMDSPTLAAATVDQSYEAAICASGGSGDYDWQLTGGALPDGLTLDEQDDCAIISGSPTASGSYTFALVVTDRIYPQLSDSGRFTLQVDETIPPLEISTVEIPDGTVNSPYQASICADGGSGTYTWQVTDGDLPPGLVGTSGTCFMLSGSPEQAGSFSFTVQVSDTGDPVQTAQRSFTLSVSSEPQTLMILVSELPDGRAGDAYSAGICAVGGEPPYTWSLAQGALPSGLSWSADGACVYLDGTPDTAGTFDFTFEVRDSGDPQRQAERVFQITIAEAPVNLTITTGTLAAGQVNSAYQAQVCAGGGTTPYDWSIVDGALPPGISAASNSCFDLSGTPTSAGPFRFRVRVTDHSDPPQSAEKDFEVTIQPEPLEIITTSLPTGRVNQAYARQLEASGGTPDYYWRIINGSLAPGLLMTGSGLIHGTPEEEGSYSFTVRVTDHGDPIQTTTWTYALTIDPPSGVQIVTTTLPDADVMWDYRARIDADYGSPPYEWDVTDGSLPIALNIGYNYEPNHESIDIEGYVQDAGTYTFSITVIDNSIPPREDTQQFTLTASPRPLEFITASPLQPATVGENIERTMWINGGSGMYEVILLSGDLPPGMSFVNREREAGMIYGIPTAAGTYGFTLYAQDDTYTDLTTSKYYEITIHAGFQITTTVLPDGERGKPFEQQIFATNGTTDYFWSLDSGSLPDGMNIFSPGGGVEYGRLSGTPNEAGTFDFTLRATDSSVPALTATQAFSLVVAPANIYFITASPLPSGTLSTAYYTEITATGGSGMYNWALQTGSELPVGLTVNELNGQGYIDGTPEETGTFVFTIEITDKLYTDISPVTKEYILTINP